MPGPSWALKSNRGALGTRLAPSHLQTVLCKVAVDQFKSCQLELLRAGGGAPDSQRPCLPPAPLTQQRQALSWADPLGAPALHVPPALPPPCCLQGPPGPGASPRASPGACGGSGDDRPWTPACGCAPALRRPRPSQSRAGESLPRGFAERPWPFPAAGRGLPQGTQLPCRAQSCHSVALPGRSATPSACAAGFSRESGKPYFV